MYVRVEDNYTYWKNIVRLTLFTRERVSNVSKFPGHNYPAANKILGRIKFYFIDDFTLFESKLSNKINKFPFSFLPLLHESSQPRSAFSKNFPKLLNFHRVRAERARNPWAAIRSTKLIWPVAAATKRKWWIGGVSKQAARKGESGRVAFPRDTRIRSNARVPATKEAGRFLLPPILPLPQTIPLPLFQDANCTDRRIRVMQGRANNEPILFSVPRRIPIPLLLHATLARPAENL